MIVRLTIRPPRSRHPRVVEFDDDLVTIGRSSSCDVQLPFQAVSGHHLTVHRAADGGYEIRDEASTNGTMLDDTPLPSGPSFRLRSGAILGIVDLGIEVDIVSALDPSHSLDHSGTMARQMLGEALLNAGGHEPVGGAYFELDDDPAAPVPIPDTLQRGHLSSAPDATMHVAALDVALEIFRDGDGFGVTLAPHAPPAPPVTVAGEPLLAERRLASGDEVVAGRVRLRFVDPLESYLAEPARTPDTLDAVAPDAQNPDASPPGWGAVEVGVLVLSLAALGAAAFLVLSVFGLL